MKPYVGHRSSRGEQLTPVGPDGPALVYRHCDAADCALPKVLRKSQDGVRRIPAVPGNVRIRASAESLAARVGRGVTEPSEAIVERTWRTRECESLAAH